MTNTNTRALSGKIASYTTDTAGFLYAVEENGEVKLSPFCLPGLAGRSGLSREDVLAEMLRLRESHADEEETHG